MKHTRVVSVVATCLVFGWPRPVHAQDPLVLTAHDSAQVLTTTLAVPPDSLAGPDASARTIWLSVRPFPHDSAQPRTLTLSDNQFAAINESFPGARPVQPTVSPFMCPPGVELRLPGTACPIRDGGIAVEIGIMRIESESVTTFGVVIRGTPNHDSPASFARGLGMLLERSGDVWRLRRTTTGFIND